MKYAAHLFVLFHRYVRACVMMVGGVGAWEMHVAIQVYKTDTLIEIGDLLTCTPMSQLCSHMQGWYDGGMHYVYARVGHVQDMVEQFTVL